MHGNVVRGLYSEELPIKLSCRNFQTSESGGICLENFQRRIIELSAWGIVHLLQTWHRYGKEPEVLIFRCIVTHDSLFSLEPSCLPVCVSKGNESEIL